MIKQFLNIHKAWIRSHIPIGGYVILNQTPTGGPHSSPVHICQRHADTQLRRRQLQLCSDAIPRIFLTAKTPWIQTRSTCPVPLHTSSQVLVTTPPTGRADAAERNTNDSNTGFSLCGPRIPLTLYPKSPNIPSFTSCSFYACNYCNEG